MKEHKKTSKKKKLNKLDIRNISESVFKTLVIINMLKELMGYFNGIKKTQADMKFTQSEIKKNLHKINYGMDEVEKQINGLECKEE